MNIKSITLDIETEDGIKRIYLDNKQTEMVSKILGLKIDNNNISYHSDKTLDHLYNMTGNPFRKIFT